MWVRDRMVERGHENRVDWYVRLLGPVLFEQYLHQIRNERRFNYRTPRVRGVVLSDEPLPRIVAARIDEIVEQFRGLSRLRESLAR